ncbi:hypothetical protein [Micromonospora orduensis]|uniref:hypothetical protein n=1 Tax=Micromonospora orduensis TaxID=1420891 RepID=UPI0033C2E391
MSDHETSDPTTTRIIEAVRLGQGGEPAQVRDLLTALWDDIGATGDPLRRPGS